jgi:hypothetical protein
MAKKAQPVAKNQHYVPQFLLRGFCREEADSLFAFDKQTGNVFPSATRNVAAENGFYNFDGGSAEPNLATLETDCAIIINRIRESESLSGLSAKDRFVLDFFVAIQILRVKSMRQMLQALRDQISALFADHGGSPLNLPGLDAIAGDEVKHMSIQNLRLAKQIVPNIENKRLLLMRTSSATPFYISDNPVVLSTSLPRQPGVGLGIGTPGVEIYLPISHTLVLQFLCSQLAANIEAGAKRAQLMKQFGINLTLDNLHALSAAVSGMAPLEIAPENVDHLNSLQCFAASRFVFSANSDFAVAHSLMQNGLKDSKAFEIQ